MCATGYASLAVSHPAYSVLTFRGVRIEALVQVMCTVKRSLQVIDVHLIVKSQS